MTMMLKLHLPDVEPHAPAPPPPAPEPGGPSPVSDPPPNGLPSPVRDPYPQTPTDSLAGPTC